MQPTQWLDRLAATDRPEGLAALAAALGFGPAAPLAADVVESLGLPESVRHALVAPGPGTTRALILVAAGDRPHREQARTIAARLTTRAPHLLWLLILTDASRREVIVATWRSSSGSPRLAALAVSREQVLPSDLDTLDALAGSMTGTDLAIHARWLEVLGREALSNRFFVALQRVVRQLADGAEGEARDEDRREVALLHVSRMLFLSFLEGRGWLNGDRRFLSASFDACMSGGGGFQRRVLAPLFFGTLNTPVANRAPRARALGRIPFLNGGLFTRAAVETRARRLVLRDDDWGVAFDDLLLRYRFTAAEETSDWQEAAIDPEMLGRAFESLMVARDRRVSGAYFTPFALVERTADAAIDALLTGRGVAGGVLSQVVAGTALDAPVAASLGAALNGIRLIDPACGTGAFLVHAVERLTRLRIASGDTRPLDRVRREVIAQSIFGVDINPTAVWLCELRLWLALVVDHPADDPLRVPPLPNLDHNIRCGDALSGGDFSHVAQQDSDAARLRTRYARATGTRKRVLARMLDRQERVAYVASIDARLALAAAQRRDLLAAARGRNLFGGRRGSVDGEPGTLDSLRTLSRQLRRQRQAIVAGGALPFSFASHFADAAQAGGFDLVVGNPPWVRLHNIAAADRERWRTEFRVFRDAAWSDGARLARAGAGFGSQVDAASLFIERGVQLLRPGGVLGYLVPAKLWRSLAGGGVRRLLAERTGLVSLEDWSEAPAMFDAATYPSLVVAREGAARETSCLVGTHRGRHQVTWRSRAAEVPLDASPGAPWLMLPPDVRAGFDRLTRAGVALAECGAGQVTLGVKTGCNEAFVVRAIRQSARSVTVSDGEREGVFDPCLARPLLRGDGVRRWRAEPSPGRILFPHDEAGRLVSPPPPALKAWLRPWRARLESRSDGRGGAWWSLFRLEGASCAKPRVVWADIGRTLQALVLPAGDPTVPLNSCYVLPTRDETDAHTVAALLNSALVDAWLSVICEPARGGYRRHLAWCMARIPVPDDWHRARSVLGPLGGRAANGHEVGRMELLDAVLDAYRLRHSAVAALLSWMNP